MELLVTLIVGKIFSILLILPTCHAVVANPSAFHLSQPEGKIITPQLFIQGDELFSFIRDRNGFTVMKDEEDWLVYARVEQKETAQGVQNCLASSGLRVGIIDPLDETFGFKMKDLPGFQDSMSINTVLFGGNNIIQDIYCASSQGKNFSATTTTAFHSETISTIFSSLQVTAADDYKNQNNDTHHRQLGVPFVKKELAKGKLRNLVVLIRFADHINRTLPSPNDYDIIMNQRGGDAILAPTGSVRDVHLEASYNQLSIESVIYEYWITLSKTEEYYADLSYGTTAKFNEAINEAMEIIDDDDSFSLSQFDKDDEGIIDVITFFHSGFGAENGGEDCETGAESSLRLWSHFRDKGISWCSSQSRKKKNLCVSLAIVATGLWGVCLSKICRIGTVAHELGHFLGLKDMYDGRGGGNGVGCYSIMGSVWGFDLSGRHPPPMDAWSKIQLGWIKPVVLNSSGVYSIEASFFTGLTYKVQEGYPEGEYLLIENRQPLGFDSALPQGGLAIWHIDESVSYQSEGFPGQVGWPENGNHYQVALLQADGKYDLEDGKNTGDSGDLWHDGSKLKNLGPSTSITKGPFPNTDSYQGGVLQQTGVEIRDISASGNNMTFTLVLPGSTLKPTPPGKSPTKVTTSSAGGSFQIPISSVAPSKSPNIVSDSGSGSKIPIFTVAASKRPNIAIDSGSGSKIPIPSVAPSKRPNIVIDAGSGNLYFTVHPKANVTSTEVTNDTSAISANGSIYTSIPEFNITFTMRENKHPNFVTLVTYTEEYLETVFSGYLSSRNISYLGLDLQIYDWSVSVPSPLDNSSLLSQEFAPGVSVTTEVMFLGELELQQKMSTLQNDAVKTALLLSLNGKQEWNGTHSFASFLLALNDTDMSDLQNITATLARFGMKRSSGITENAINVTGKQRHGHDYTAGIAMMVAVLVLLTLVGGLFILRVVEIQEIATFTESAASLRPLNTTDAMISGNISPCGEDCTEEVLNSLRLSCISLCNITSFLADEE